MKSWLNALWIPALLAVGVLAEEVELVRTLSFRTSSKVTRANIRFLSQAQDEAHRQKCAGMYSRKAWGGDVDPFILAKFTKTVEKRDDNDDPLLSLVIFEWEDVDRIGVVPEGEDEDDSGYVRLISFLRIAPTQQLTLYKIGSPKNHLRSSQYRGELLR
jgi:hypothetical protein